MKHLFRLLFGLSFLFLVGPVFSADLMVVYEDAMRTAPVVQSAAALKLAADEDFQVAGSIFLPQLNFTGQWNQNHVQTDERYRSSQLSLNLTQVLFNRKAWYFAKTKGLSALVARYDYQAIVENFIYQIAFNYCSVLSARQSQKVAAARFIELKNFYDGILHRFQVGLSSAVDLSKAKAGMDEAYAYQVAADHALLIADEQLASLTGKHYDNFSDFSKDYFVIVPEPDDLEIWKTKAFAGNDEIREKILLRDIQKETINIERSSYIPSVSLFASNINYNQNLSGLYANNGHLNDKVIGIQFAWTVFAGAGYSASVAQQRDLLAYRDFDLTLKRKQIAEAIQTDWLHLHSALSEQKAYIQSVNASESALKSYQSQFEAGTVTLVDVLEKIQAYYQAQSDYYDAQYQAILAWLSFKKDVGILSKDDLIQLNAQLMSNQATGPVQ